jgi:hypothetical protein
MNVRHVYLLPRRRMRMALKTVAATTRIIDFLPV